MFSVEVTFFREELAIFWGPRGLRFFGCGWELFGRPG